MKARAWLLAQASKVLPAHEVERLDAASDRAIQEAVLARVCPDFGTAGQSDAYVAGAFRQVAQLGRLDAGSTAAVSGGRFDAAVPDWQRPLAVSLDRPEVATEILPRTKTLGTKMSTPDWPKPIYAERRAAKRDPRLPDWMQPLSITKVKSNGPQAPSWEHGHYRSPRASTWVKS